MRWGAGVAGVAAALAIAAPAHAHPGDLDDHFGVGGIFQSDATPEDGSTGGLAVDDDGRAFYVEDLNTGATLVAVTSSGKIDRSFGTNGKVDLSSEVLGITMAVSPEGKVLVAGVNPANTTVYNDDTIVRLTPDGRLDPTFGNGGVLRLQYPGWIGDIGFDRSGRLVVLASSPEGAQLLRLNDAGGYDTSFGNDGISPIGVPGSARSLAFGPDDSMFVLFDLGTFKAEKYTPSGQLDTEFGQDGIATVDTTGNVALGGGYTVDPRVG
jgi:uncharacterized delta-60 repeat protein